MPRSTGSTCARRTGRRRARGRPATSHHDARQSTGGSSNVMSMPKPTVTADVASGSIRPVSSSRPRRRAAVIARAASAPTRHGDAPCATAVVRSDVERGASGSTPSADAGPHLGPPRWRHAASE